MLIKGFARRAIGILCTSLVVGVPVVAQRSVNLLHAPDQPVRAVADRDLPVAAPAAFTFERNLIFFEASVNGESGNFILDTGAPTLVVNNRGRTDGGGNYTGYGSGGTVTCTDYRVEDFRMTGRTVRNYWAIGLDLRGMEDRTGRVIDGMVGYDLLNDGELRIDYAARSFRLLPSSRKPLHDSREPLAVLKFSLVDHLPVIRLRINGKRYNFAIDTGAGVNLVDDDLITELPLSLTADQMNIQGLDGQALTVDLYTLLLMQLPPSGTEPAPVDFVATELQHLQENGQQIAGILGSAFLSRYTVGIDYRRRRIYLW